METYDACIIGGGLIGLAVGRALYEQRPGLSLLILEKEDRVAGHQSGHNSGVIHSGLYYRPGSLKARLAVAGARSMYELCAEAGIAHSRSGKLVIATDRSQLPALDELERRGNANGLEGLGRIRREEIREIEPAATGESALVVPAAGVVDFREVAEYLARGLAAAGATVDLGSRVTRIRETATAVEIGVDGSSFRSRLLVNCAGLHSDRVARMTGMTPPVQIIPFRGEYYTMRGGPHVNALIYPVPDPRFPFLGVHFTRRVDGSVEVGPNALVALGREHYRGSRPNWSDVSEMVRYQGFRRLARANLVPGAREFINSKSKRLYSRLAARLVPQLRSEHLEAGGVGVRAQAVDSQGRLVDDFVIETTEKAVHVLNAPSPGATASLAIGDYVAALTGPLFQGRGGRNV